MNEMRLMKILHLNKTIKQTWVWEIILIFCAGFSSHLMASPLHCLMMEDFSTYRKQFPSISDSPRSVFLSVSAFSLSLVEDWYIYSKHLFNKIIFSMWSAIFLNQKVIRMKRRTPYLSIWFSKHLQTEV